MDDRKIAKLPPIGATKTTLKILQRSEAPLPSWVTSKAERTALFASAHAAANPLGSAPVAAVSASPSIRRTAEVAIDTDATGTAALGEAASPLAASGHASSKWLAHGGRLRIGGDGVAVKFTDIKHGLLKPLPDGKSPGASGSPSATSGAAGPAGLAASTRAGGGGSSSLGASGRSRLGASGGTLAASTAPSIGIGGATTTTTTTGTGSTTTTSGRPCSRAIVEAVKLLRSLVPSEVLVATLLSVSTQYPAVPIPPVAALTLLAAGKIDGEALATTTTAGGSGGAGGEEEAAAAAGGEAVEGFGSTKASTMTTTTTTTTSKAAPAAATAVLLPAAAAAATARATGTGDGFGSLFLQLDEGAMPLYRFDGVDAASFRDPAPGETVYAPLFASGSWVWRPALVRSVHAAAADDHAHDPAGAGGEDGAGVREHWQYVVEFADAKATPVGEGVPHRTGGGGGGDSSGDDTGMGTGSILKILHRLDVCVEGEDPLAYSLRFLSAVMRREAAKHDLRLRHYVDAAAISDSTLTGVGRDLLARLVTRTKESLAARPTTASQRKAAQRDLRDSDDSGSDDDGGAGGGDDDDEVDEDGGSGGGGGGGGGGGRRAGGRGAGAAGGAGVAAAAAAAAPRGRGFTMSAGTVRGLIASATATGSGGGRGARSPSPLAAGASARSPHYLLLKRLLKEVAGDYRLALQYALMRHAAASVQAQGLATSIASGDVVSVRSQLPNRTAVPFSDAAEARAVLSALGKLGLMLPMRVPRVPYYAKVPTGAEAFLFPVEMARAFKATLASLGSAASFVHKRLVDLTLLAAQICRRITSQAAFYADVSAQQPLPLMEFVQTQARNASQLMTRFSSDWSRDLANLLIDGLPRGLPGFDVANTDLAANAETPLHAYVYRLEQQMTTCLREVLHRTCAAVRDLLQSYVDATAAQQLQQHRQHAEDDGDRDQAAAGGADASAWDGAASIAPLLQCKLVLKRVSSNPASAHSTAAAASAAVGTIASSRLESPRETMAILAAQTPVHVRLSPSPTEVVNAFLAIIGGAINAVRSVCGIEDKVLLLMRASGLQGRTLLNLGHGDALCSDLDELLADTKAWVKDTVTMALLGHANAVAVRLQPFAWLSDASVEDEAAHAIDDSLKAAEAKAAAAAAAARAPPPGKGGKPSSAGAAGGSGSSGTGSSSSAAADGKQQAPASLLGMLRPLPVLPDLDTLVPAVRRFHDAAEAIARAVYDTEQCGLVTVSTTGVKRFLHDRAVKVRDTMLSHAISRSMAVAAEVALQYQTAANHISRPPSHEGDLVDLHKCLEALPSVMDSLLTRTRQIVALLQACEPFRFVVPPEALQSAWALFLEPGRMQTAVRRAQERLGMDARRMHDELSALKHHFSGETRLLEARIAAFKQRGLPSLDDLQLMVNAAGDIDADLRAAIDKAADIASREVCLGLTATNYGHLNALQEDFEPFFRLWNSLADFLANREQWSTNNILTVDAAEVEADVMERWNSSYRLMKHFGDTYPGAAAAAKQLRMLTDDFKRNVPLIRCLASKALAERHWVAISEKAGRDIFPAESDVTLKDLLDAGLLAIFDDIEDIAATAEKEFSLKKAVDAMKVEWESIKFDVVAYKETGSYVVRGTDDINQVLDDQIVKTQTMLGSPYIRPFLVEVKGWEATLVNVQAVLEEWLLFQRGWLYLEPIFSSEDIMRQLPLEGRRFGIIDKLYRRTLQEAHDAPRVLEACGKEKQLEKLRDANKMVDQIQKGLSDYLEVKRLAFPRFFFLSDDELLEILAETKDPTRVQAHLGKCFEGIARVEFTAAPEQHITHMSSPEGERVELAAIVDPNNPKAKGNVEVWLTQLQDTMKSTVRAITQKAYVSYGTTQRDAWVLQWPAQVVLAGSQLWWTEETEAALASGGTEGLARYEAKLNGQLDGIVRLVRGKLDKLQRMTLGALCVVDVHARDVISDMVRRKVERKGQFDWQAQLRYYWEQPAAPADAAAAGDSGRAGAKPGAKGAGAASSGAASDRPSAAAVEASELSVRCISSSLRYGYEYLGNSSRLVITPLTDRCYRTLMGAIALLYGGAPAGPAGTGKTETTKDLGKAVSVQCVVFNCGDGLDYLAMAKFFKGLSASGAWACFDEFNRIDIEVLSVVAQQILTITRAKRANLQRFVFEGTTLPLNPMANVFITMNPGYAGRSELPENLKALFRPCAMMVPDYALIAEIKLYSFGFSKARAMGRKLTQVLRLASEQLSSQKHYDFGMRTVFSILLRAGALKQSMGDAWSEEVIIQQSILDVNVPKFTSNDLPLFRGVVGDLFPGLQVPEPDYDLLTGALKAVCKRMNVQPKEDILNSAIQLFETVQVRHGLMLVGETSCGKTTVLRMLQAAMSDLKGQREFVNVNVHSINPKSITAGQLFGVFDENTHEWTDGVLAFKFRTCAGDTREDRNWIMFDGPIDAVWIENMNTVLDDNKKLCLNSGAIIKMSPRMTIMFETDSLEQASPATVSRVGMVYMEPARLGWRPLLQSWLATLPRSLRAKSALIVSLFEWLLPPMLHCVLVHSKVLTPVTALHLTHALLTLFGALLAKPFGKKGLESPVANVYTGPDVANVSVGNASDQEDVDIDEDDGGDAAPAAGAAAPASDADAAGGDGDDDDGDAGDLGALSAKRGVAAGAGLRLDSSKNAAQAAVVIEGLFILSMVWSVGSVLDVSSRQQFSALLLSLLHGTVEGTGAADGDAGEGGGNSIFEDFRTKNPNYDAHIVGGGYASRFADGDVREGDHRPVAGAADDGTAAPQKLTSGEKRISAIPPPIALDGSAGDGHTVFDFHYAPTAASAAGGASSGYSWVPWRTLVPSYSVPRGSSITDIIVPTADTTSVSCMLDVLLLAHAHVLAVGETGTAKSVTMEQKLVQGLPADIFQPVMIAFSAQTSANATQDAIDARMSRRRKGVFGPVLGQRFVVFVDDLNMPAKETYGAQPPIELLRQYMDHGGWYDRRDKEKSFMEIVDTQFAAAMGPPGGGRTRISQRYVRHFNVLGFVPFSPSALGTIFETMLTWSTTKHSAAVKAMVPRIVAATIQLYSRIAESLLPTPIKTHYTFNLRDVSNVIVGIHGAAPSAVPDAGAYARLWAHEATRVFHDRLTDDADRKAFHAQLLDTARGSLGVDEKVLLLAGSGVAGSTSAPLWSSIGGAVNNAYSEAADPAKIANALALQLEDYNSMTTRPMKLVMCGYAVEHVLRIARILLQPQGNALLVGVGGSGRRSLCTLAAYVVGYKLQSIELTRSYGVTEWKDDLKKLLFTAGRDGKQVVFMLSDTQIVKESFVEDVNNLLNKGDVPNLFAPDERNEIITSMQSIAKKTGRELRNNHEATAMFTERVRQNLHVVLCFSPIGDVFRTRLRMFPSLVNCTTINWFTAWPDEALRSVASFVLSGADIPGPADIKETIIDVFTDMQQRVTALSQRLLTEMKRHYYVTPTSYLELLNTFQALLGARRSQLDGARVRYENGISKLLSTEEQVATMQAELVALQPKLAQASAETEAMIANIQVVSAEVAQKAEVVAVEEGVCKEKASAAKAIKDDCEAQLAEAIPILEAAVAALNNLKKSDIIEVKSMKAPPSGVKLTMEAVCIMFSLAPKKGAKEGFWELALKELLNDPRLVDRLKGYNADNVPVSVIDKLTPYMSRDDFQPDAVTKVSYAAGGLATWVHAVFKYDKVAKVVAPKRAALAEASATLAEAQAALDAKQAELKALRAKLNGLKEELAETQQKKNALAKEVEECSARLDRAQRLITGLGSEKVRWAESVQQLKASSETVVGDIALSSGMVAYLGAFPAAYRDSAVAHWSSILRARGVTCTTPFKLSACLGDAVEIRSWTAAKLPNDAFSVDNAIMMKTSRRWPLCIDPQQQANRWIKNMEAGNALKVVRQNQANFLRVIETAIQFGSPVLLENVGETLDPVLEPLLLRQVVRVGTSATIRLGDSVVEYDERFKLVMTSVLPNPHYSPETCVKVNLVNFMVTQEGLQDQMLGLVVKLERPDLEEQREKMVLADAEYKRQLKELEDRVLALLAASSGNILDDEVLITTLGESKATSNNISRQLEAAERTTVKIGNARQGYMPVARRSAMLFFCVADLAGIDPMYQFSLSWYTRLFALAVEKAPKYDQLDKRLRALQETFLKVLYDNVCRSLFEVHKLLFSALLAFKLFVGDGKLPASEVKFFLQGSPALKPRRPNPLSVPSTPGVNAADSLVSASVSIVSEGSSSLNSLPMVAPEGSASDGAGGSAAWLTDQMWMDVLELATLPAFANFDTQFEKGLSRWSAIMTAQDPLFAISNLTSALPFTTFQKLCILRCLRVDKVLPSLRAFISTELGSAFVEPPPFSLQACYEDSSAITPLIFVLSAGTDPMRDLIALAENGGSATGAATKAQQRKLTYVSLGQGQGPVAEKMIEEAVDSGGWVCLQNCHLAPSFMPTLERIVEELQPTAVHENFRLWLTAAPSPTFPVSVLQAGIKMTLELPTGVRAGLQASYLGIDPQWYASIPDRSVEFNKLVFCLCFFHALVCERRKFGPLGWVIRYDYSDSDLRISLDQLKAMLEDPANGTTVASLPFSALQYLTGETNYGGRVTDDVDRRLLNTLLADVYCSAAVTTPKYALSPTSKIYTVPDPGTHAVHLAAIKALPPTDSPEAFGLHPNAEISVAINDASKFLGTVLAVTYASLTAAAAAPAAGKGAAGGAAAGGGSDSKSSADADAGGADASGAAGAASADASSSSSSSTADDGASAAAASPANALLATVTDIATRLPRVFDIEKLSVLYPVQYDQSLNTVLVQECIRYNGVVKVMTDSLRDLTLALKGVAVMSTELEAVSVALSQSRVPAMWKAVSYPSVKPLASWVNDLLQRLEFFTHWIEEGIPSIFWISGFFFTQSFLTGVRQNSARKHRMPIDELAFSFRVLTPPEIEAVSTTPDAAPTEGALVDGLFLQGARWDDATDALNEAAPRELFSPLPVMHLLPAKVADLEAAAMHTYECPVYKTSERAGTLSTTGHSTNLIMMVQLAISPAHTPQHWTKRGVALISQLDA